MLIETLGGIIKMTKPLEILVVEDKEENRKAILEPMGLKYRRD